MINISLNFVFTFFNYFLSSHHFFIGVFQVSIYITIIITTCLWAVLCPVSKAQPTKAIITFSTSHVHTTLVLFNISIAFWTRFTISLYPSQVFRIILFLFVPKSNLFTWCWLVLFLSTFKAKACATITLHCILVSKVWSFNNVTALDVWTPLDIFVVICKLFTMPLNILLLILIFKCFAFWVLFFISFNW